MKGVLTCTLVLEHNYRKSEAQLGSVWLFNGDGTADLEKREGLDSLLGWTRIAGPLDYTLASQIAAALRQFLEQSGVGVIDKGVTD